MLRDMAPPSTSVEEAPASARKVKNAYYEEEMARLQVELVKQQEFIRARGLRAVVIFEGRDAAGKGGAIQRLTAGWDPRAFKVWPISAPTAEEKARHFLWRFWNRLQDRTIMDTNELVMSIHLGNGLTVFGRSIVGRSRCQLGDGSSITMARKGQQENVTRIELLLSTFDLLVDAFYRRPFVDTIL